MKKFILPIAVCFVLISSSFAQKKEAARAGERVTQTFRVFAGEKKLASDLVIRVGWLQAVDLLTFADGMKVVRMDLVYDEFQFRSFKLSRDNKEELTVKARRDSFAISHVTKGSSSLPRRGDEIILEPNGWGQYAFLINRYNAARGGKQTFRALVPSRQKVIPVTVERLGSDRFQCGAIVLEATRYRIIQEGKDVFYLWSARDGKIVGIHQPAREICVVDEEYEDLHQNIRALTLGEL